MSEAWERFWWFTLLSFIAFLLEWHEVSGGLAGGAGVHLYQAIRGNPVYDEDRARGRR